MGWMAVFYIIIAGLFIWFLVRNYRANPAAYSKENFVKSFRTMGLLALGLIAFIAVLVMLLRN